jgi:hypothetical protein
VTGNAATVSPFASPRRPTTPPRLWLHTRQVTDLVNAVTTEVIARRAAGGAAGERVHGGGADGRAGLGAEERLARVEGRLDGLDAKLAGLDAKLDAKLGAVLQALSACREPAPAAGLLPLPPLATGRAPGRRGRTSRAGQ